MVGTDSIQVDWEVRRKLKRDHRPAGGYRAKYSREVRRNAVSSDENTGGENVGAKPELLRNSRVRFAGWLRYCLTDLAIQSCKGSVGKVSYRVYPRFLPGFFMPWSAWVSLVYVLKISD